MQFKATIQHGPLTLEIEGESREELQEEILELAEFVEGNGSSLSAFDLPDRQDQKGSNEAPSHTPSSDSGGDATPPAEDVAAFASVSQQTSVDEEILAQLFDLPDDEEGTPKIHTYHFDDGTEVLGKARNQRQAQASALLLYLWDVCLDEKKIEYERLDEALTDSDIETERRDAMGQAFADEAREWFESGGGEMWIVGTGKNHVRGLIEELAEKMQE